MTDANNRGLTLNEAVETWILNYEGWNKDRIAAKFDVNVYRLYEVWEEKKHIGSRQLAEEAINQRFPEAAKRIVLTIHVRKKRVLHLPLRPPSDDQIDMDF